MRSDAPERRRDLGAITLLADSARMLLAHAVPFGMLTVLAFLPTLLWRASDLAALVDSSADGRGTPLSLWLLPTVLPCQLILAALMTPLAGAYVSSREVTVRASIVAVVPRLGSVLLTAFLCTCAVWIGTAACIVPGAVLMAILWEALPLTVAERSGPIDAMSRSGTMTNDVRATVLAIVVVLLFCLVAPWVSLRIAVSFGAMSESTALFLDAPLTLLVGAWGAAAQSLSYHRLRWTHDREDSDVAAVFS